MTLNGAESILCVGTLENRVYAASLQISLSITNNRMCGDVLVIKDNSTLLSDDRNGAV